MEGEGGVTKGRGRAWSAGQICEQGEGLDPPLSLASAYSSQRAVHNENRLSSFECKVN